MLPLLVQAAWQDSVQVIGPVVPDRVPDSYVPAHYQEIDGYLGYRLGVNLERRLLRIDSATILSGVERRPGAQTWIGEHVGKFLFSAAKTYAYSHDARLRALMDAVARTYIGCQLPDGYLGTYLEKDRWTAWDVWAHKYAIIGLLNYYSVTGYAPALRAAENAADLICRTFGDSAGKKDLMPAGEHDGLAPGSILEPMVDLYRYTGNPKYLAFCRYILRAYEQPDGPRIVSQIERYGDVTKVGDAKAYEMLSCFLGILKYYKLTGEERYWKVLQEAWLDIVEHRLYITGTASDHEIFRPAGSLRATNADEMGEGCVTVTWVQFNLGLLKMTGKLRYAEEVERSLYNHLLAAENPETGCVSYYTALQGAKPYRCDQGYSCCLSSVPRGISLIPEMIEGTIGGRFSVLMYETGAALARIRMQDGSELALAVRCSTTFPMAGEARLDIEPEKECAFPINLRVPGWAENFSATVGDQTFSGQKDGWLTIRRTWKPGDRVVIHFGLPVRVLKGGDSYPGAVAIQRGPQVLAIDKGLNPRLDSLGTVRFIAGAGLSEATRVLPADLEWKEAFYMEATVKNELQTVVLVPFAEAGQTTAPVAVWIAR